MNEGEFLVHAYTDPGPGTLDVPWWTFTGDLILKLALVLVLIYASMWLLRRFVQRTNKSVLRKGTVNVLEQTPLAPNRSLYLVEFGNRVLLLGATASQVTTLAEIKDPAELAALRQSAGEPQAQSVAQAISQPLVQPFAKTLRALVERQPQQAPAVASAAPEVEDNHDYMKGKIAELREISNRFGPR